MIDYDSETDLSDNLKSSKSAISSKNRSHSHIPKKPKLNNIYFSYMHRRYSYQNSFSKKKINLKRQASNSFITQSSLSTSGTLQSFSSYQQSEENVLTFSSSDYIRYRYYKSLIYKGVWYPRTNNTKKMNMIIILDWDDTLLCTSDLMDKDGNIPLDVLNKMSSRKKSNLKILEKKVYTLLSFSLSKGDTYIVTNSKPGWVGETARKFYPSILELLSRVTIISARGLYEEYFPGQIGIWKKYAFNKIVHNYNSNLISNIVCIGDSEHDIEAGKSFGRNFPYSVIKTVQFNKTPKIEDLNAEIGLVLDKFNYIINTVKNWTIKVTKNNQKKI